MTATGNELTLLKHLKLVKDYLTNKISAKLNKPSDDGTDGQLLVADDAGGTQWKSQIGTANIADGAVTTAKLADSAVTTIKVADKAITANKIADGAIPIVPTNVSAFENDAKYQNDTEMRNAIAEAITSVYRYNGSVDNQAALPTNGNVVGDVYNVNDTNMNYAWNGTVWDPMAPTVTLASLGVTASATELNYVDGVTSNVQTQLNNIRGSIHEYVLPIAGTELGGVKNGGNVIVAADGTMNVKIASDEDFRAFMGMTD